ncbi:MAG: DUF3179 domain-containing (seleno)protein, partial [Rhodospirillaceae bacterium]
MFRSSGTAPSPALGGHAAAFVAAVLALTLVLTAFGPPILGADVPAQWRGEWPDTDFSKTAVDLESIRSGGPPKDGIPPIHNPKFEPAHTITNLGAREPVILLQIEGQTRIYPLRVLIWHEIVNDVIEGKPVAVTYCPLCNAAITFSRELNGDVLSFGTTGKLRNSDLV